MPNQLPKVFYGLHFYPGVAEYRKPGKESMRVFLNENTLRSMDASFAGRPLFVIHVEQVNLATLQQDADGYVIKSFYNEADGKHWVQFIVVSDKGHEAISKGYRLSNAYTAGSFAPGGCWNGVDYSQEISSGTYDHLALVNNPRYNESILFTPEEYNAYNNEKLMQLRRVANSADDITKAKQPSEKRSMFDFFKKTKVENEKIEELTVTLPKSGKQITIAELIASADSVKNADKEEPKDEKESKDEPKEKSEKDSEDKGEDKAEDKGEEKSEGKDEKPEGDAKDEAAKAVPQMADLDHHVMVGNSSMPLRDMMAKHSQMADCMNALAEHHSEMMKSAMPGAPQENPLIKKNEITVEPKEKPEIKNANFKKLLNAKDEAAEFESGIVTKTHLDGLLKGKARYGAK